MIEAIYAVFSAVGYTHPLHPAVTHLTVGLTLAALIFGVVAAIFHGRELENTVRHCLVLALLAWVPTAILGLLDWQHFYQGAGLSAIRVKLALAGVLPVLLLLALARSRRSLGRQTPPLLILMLAAMVVMGLGYFGGELVYGNPARTEAAPAPTDAAGVGRELFEAKCSFCHHTHTTEAKVGPGLKGIYGFDALPSSKWPMTDANVVRQMKAPFKNMPAFTNLSETEMAAIIAYLKTL